MMEVARRLDCTITLAENCADAVYSMDGLSTQYADAIAGDAAIMADCARYIAAALTAEVPSFANTFHRAKIAAVARARMMQQGKGGAV